MKVSIIIPVYNAERYLGRCLESVLKQTYTDFEVLLINDGSLDRSGAICRKYANRDNRIRYIEQENRGLSAARNVGLDTARGEYVFFVDSDDYINFYTLEKIVYIIEHEGCDIVCIGLGKVFENDEKPHEMKEVPVLYEKCDNQVFYKNIISSHVCGKLYKKKLFEGINYPLGMNYEDIATTHRIFYRASIIAYTSAELYYYRIHSDSITNICNKRNMCDLLKAYRLVNEFYNEVYGSIEVIGNTNFGQDILYYELTVLFTVYSKLLRGDASTRDILNMGKRYLRNEFCEIESKINLQNYKGLPMTNKILLYKYHVAGIFIKARIILGNIFIR